MMSGEASGDALLLAGTKPWNRQVYDDVIGRFPGKWRYVSERKQLTTAFLRNLSPRYIFFLHWSWIVPGDIVDNHECVCFHMTDVPYGRGGSPLQNLILRGHKETKLTALRMVRELDAGAVYSKESLSLEGRAEDIYTRAMELAARMIRKIIEEQPTPQPQTGEVVTFKRRTPDESEIPTLAGPEALYDFIRMLDADGYLHAFLRHAGLRYEFRNARIVNERLVADAVITPDGSGSK